MANIVTTYSNFARAKIDHDMMGRFGLPIYQTSYDVFENWLSNFKGNAIYRTGFEDMLGEFQDCVLHEFRFRNDQNYLMVFYNTKIRFLTYDANGVFGWVESSPSVILEVTTSYTLDECRELQFTQNGDVTVITHNSHAPQDLTRVSATSFTIGAHTLTPADPFGSGEFPASCLFYKGRLYFANTPSKTTTIWASEAGDFTEFTIGVVTDVSPLQFTIAEIVQPIEWLFGGENSLVVGCADAPVAVNGGGVGVAITADTVEANKTSGDGSNSSIPFSKDGQVFYVGKNSRNMYYFSYDLLTESFLSKDANLISYDITNEGIGKIRHKKDRNDIIYGIRGDGDLVSLNFKIEENIIGWHSHSTPNGLFKDIGVITNNEGDPQLFALVLRDGAYFIERQAPHMEFSKRSAFFTDIKADDDEAYNRVVAEELSDVVYLDNSLKASNLQEANTITFGSGGGFTSGFSSGFRVVATSGSISAASAVFSSGDVGKHISYKTETGYESGRFLITAYTSTTQVEVDILQQPTSNTYDNWYLSFNQLSGLTQYIGTTISIVTDGGYLDDFAITADTLDLENQALTVVTGYKYRGTIKSFSLGFQIKAENTQTTMKNISRVGIRSVASAGGMFGTTPYRLEPIQKLTQKDLNYLPPLPMDGTNFTTYGDDTEIDKYFYLIQDKPLPFVAAAVMIDADHTITR